MSLPYSSLCRGGTDRGPNWSMPFWGDVMLWDWELLCFLRHNISGGGTDIVKFTIRKKTGQMLEHLLPSERDTMLIGLTFG